MPSACSVFSVFRTSVSTFVTDQAHSVRPSAPARGLWIIMEWDLAWAPGDLVFSIPALTCLAMDRASNLSLLI